MFDFAIVPSAFPAYFLKKKVEIVILYPQSASTENYFKKNNLLPCKPVLLTDRIQR